MGKRLLYLLLGYGVAWIPFFVWWAFTGKFKWVAALWLGISFSNLLLYIGERSGKLKPIEELKRPLTLFPRDLTR
jgi:hypothetical protein